jgi:heme exporter protein D
MQWHSLGEFLAMGGYAFYVWGSVGACALAMLVEPWVIRSNHRRIVRSLGPARGAAADARSYGSSATAGNAR